MVTPSTRPTTAAEVPVGGSDEAPPSGSLNTRGGRSARFADQGTTPPNPLGGLGESAGIGAPGASGFTSASGPRVGDAGRPALDPAIGPEGGSGGAGSDGRGMAGSFLGWVDRAGRVDRAAGDGATSLVSFVSLAPLASDRSAAASAAAVMAARWASSSGVDPVRPVAAL